MSSECEEPRHFCICHPQSFGPIVYLKRRGFSDPNSIFFPRASTQQSAPRKNHSSMAGRRSSSSRSRSSRPGGRSNMGGSPCGITTGKMMPPAAVIKVRTPPLLWRGYCPICINEKKKNFFILNRGMGFLCATPPSWVSHHSFPRSIYSGVPHYDYLPRYF